jgi:rare lipoprotein A
MRKGSTVLGSLGLTCSQVTLLILPLLAAGAVANEVVFAPRALYAAEEETMPAEVASPDEEAAQRAALERRSSWLVENQPSRGAKAKPAKSTVKPVKIIHTRATWYGPGFHGRRTASGERFNRNAMTLASRHLPFGTRVRVVNPKTGRSAIARVNDRGPFRGGYTADLSQGLARRIGLSNSGAVRLEILPKTAQK